MFGQHDYQDQNQSTGQNDQTMGTPEPVADGTLGTPMGDPMDSSASEEHDLPAAEATQPVQVLPPTTDTGAVGSRGDTTDTPGGLLNIKQQALQQLKPLVGHLEQTPEEKFRTTMMMIQAADDQSLIQEAYQAAQAIEDEKVRAQALLDVVNEINYFTSQNFPKGN